MINELRTGEIITSLGTTHQARSCRTGSQVITQAHGKYAEASRNEKMCFSYCAARATSVPATAQIGNIIWNPPGSGVVLALGKWSAQIQVTSATTLGITLGYSAQAIQPTTITVANSSGNCFLNAASPGNMRAKAYAIGTLLVVPTVVMNLFHNTAAIATTGVDKMDGDFDGMFTVPPGYAVVLSAITAAVAASGMTSTLTWEELPE